MSQIFIKKKNRILPESRSPFPFAGPVFFSTDEDEFCILETSKRFSTLTRVSPLPLVHPAARYLETTKTKTSEYFNQINHINSLGSPNLAEPEQSGHQLVATQRSCRLETPESGRRAAHHISTEHQSQTRCFLEVISTTNMDTFSAKYNLSTNPPGWHQLVSRLPPQRPQAFPTLSEVILTHSEWRLRRVLCLKTMALQFAYFSQVINR